MRNRCIGFIFRGSTLAVITALTLAPWLFARKASAQDKQSASAAAKTAGQTPDLSGVWIAPTFPNTFTKEEPPMQPWAAKKYKETIAQHKGDVDPDSKHCSPPGPTRILLHHYPFEIVQVPGRVLLFFEYDHIVRQVYMDGRGHPKGDDLDPSWMGHSIGKWDGDSLVIDTVGLNEITWLDEIGHPHTDALHVTERIRRADKNTLTVDLTFDDPKAYTKTWTAQKIFKLRQGWEIAEHVCEDNFLWKPKEDAGKEPPR